ncbi:hypothetical protein SERLA73DRAFT_183786 [Serpula lacrymans var. lacrymans S7.3]|uniref:Uncharacterized protein n=2 Tax=Serpula lacrymans var. lacrymans TaxID=341189 RepID=F8Q1U3_SERL3|nr:uncharacterized protein SERLADRAFT_471150 [Serpula lacrymans var. lacrymans S7.9]EGN97154.1 hypothetical protein SERLA73DRAFT_183786 [Serpula lacrymans var. lacrymans S7.3]EGO22762.1 hypothetical protein SERLADRAFT_471150 [Serpula lacrymans var. lacrymans S7.9]
MAGTRDMDSDTNNGPSWQSSSRSRNGKAIQLKEVEKEIIFLPSTYWKIEKMRLQGYCPRVDLIPLEYHQLSSCQDM